MEFLNFLRKKRRQQEAPKLEDSKTSSMPASLPSSAMLRPPIADMLSQQQCPLFNTLPPEIRNRIYHFALSPYTKKESPYATNEYFYRPQFRYRDQYLDTALLRTCQLIHSETSQIPASKYVAVEFHSRAPPDFKSFTHLACGFTTSRLQHLHLFTQQIWLEDHERRYRHLVQFHRSLQTLKITLRHSDWWFWENSEPLAFHPTGDSSATRRHDDLGIFNLNLRAMTKLRKLELELETVEGKQAELDQILKNAPAWQFPLDFPPSPPSSEPTDPDLVEEVALVLNSNKTQKWGWWGDRLPSGIHVDNDPVRAKARLVKLGVDFAVPDGEPEILTPNRLTYYVVNLVFERRKMITGRGE